MNIAEVQNAESKRYLFVAMDRTSKLAVTQLVENADRRTASEFLEHLLKVVPYRIHTFLTDNVLAREQNAVLGVRSLDIRARQIQCRSDPPVAGTEHLGGKTMQRSGHKLNRSQAYIL
jgi:transposase-like protein